MNSHDSTAIGRLPEFSERLHVQLVQLLKLLADDKRLRIILHLSRRGESHVSQLCHLLEQNQPAVSHHLALMRDAGMIECRRDGKHNYYSICPTPFRELIDSLFDALADGDAHTIRLDRLILKRMTGPD